MIHHVFANSVHELSLTTKGRKCGTLSAIPLRSFPIVGIANPSNSWTLNLRRTKSCRLHLESTRGRIP